MIDAISRRMAVGIKEAIPDHPASVEVMRYAIASLINLLGTIVVSVGVAIYLGHLGQTVLALVAFIALRMISGGRHLDSSAACIALTASTTNIIPYIHLSDTYIYVLTPLTMLIAFIYAPCNLEQRSRIPARYYSHLKYLTVIVIASNLLLLSSTICICFLLQCLSIVRQRR